MATEVAEAAGHAAEHALTPSAYIAEHLQNFNSIGGKQASVVDFSVINWDTMFWSVLMGLIGIIIAMIVNWFLASPALYYAFSIIGVLVFAGLTAYDTQKIKRMYFEGDGQELTSKKAVLGALTLYLDFINMFLFLLRLFGSRD